MVGARGWAWGKWAKGVKWYELPVTRLISSGDGTYSVVTIAKNPGVNA